MRVIATERFYRELRLTTSALMPPERLALLRQAALHPEPPPRDEQLAPRVTTEFRMRSSGNAARRQVNQGNSERQSPVELQWAGA
jgi:hypothetical protein